MWRSGPLTNCLIHLNFNVMLLFILVFLVYGIDVICKITNLRK